MGGWFRRVELATPLAGLGSVVVVVLTAAMWIHHTHDEELRLIANWINLFGAMITAAGLAYAYGKAETVPWWRRLLEHLGAARQPIVLTTAPALVRLHGGLALGLHFSMNDTEDRTDQLIESCAKYLDKRLAAIEAQHAGG